MAQWHTIALLFGFKIYVEKRKENTSRDVFIFPIGKYTTIQRERESFSCWKNNYKISRKSWETFNFKADVNCLITMLTLVIKMFSQKVWITQE